MSQARVSILMGSASDLPTMVPAVRELKRYGVPYDLQITSAHRSPDRTVEYVRDAEKDGTRIFICGAGMAAHLAGVVAAHTVYPVLGVPLPGSKLSGLDSLLSTVQMPKGIPVGTLAVGSHGAINAAILACQILALGDEELGARLRHERQEMARTLQQASNDAVQSLDKLLEDG